MGENFQVETKLTAEIAAYCATGSDGLYAPLITPKFTILYGYDFIVLLQNSSR